MTSTDTFRHHGAKLMRNQPAAVIALFGLLALSGCGAHIPDCDDPDIKEAVASLIEDHFDADPNIALAGSVVAEIREISASETLKTGAKQCTAAVVLIPPQHAPKSLLNTEQSIVFRIAPSKDGLSYSILIDWP